MHEPESVSIMGVSNLGGWLRFTQSSVMDYFRQLNLWVKLRICFARPHFQW